MTSSDKERIDLSAKEYANAWSPGLDGPEKPDNSKPDFEAMAKSYADSYYNYKDRQEAYKAGMEKLYSDIYLPKVREMDSQIAQEIKVRDGLKDMYDFVNKELFNSKKYIQELRDKIKTLEEEIQRIRSQKSKQSPCPKCGSTSVIMFTPDLDICNDCNHQF